MPGKQDDKGGSFVAVQGNMAPPAFYAQQQVRAKSVPPKAPLVPRPPRRALPLSAQPLTLSNQ